MFLFLSLFATLTWYLYSYFIKTFDYWRSKNVEGPEPLPLFGNFKDVALKKKPKGIFFSEMYKQYPKEKFVGFYQMASPALLIRDLNIVKQVLIKEFNKFPDRGTYFSKKGLGENIFHSDSETWKTLRKQFSSVFTSSKFRAVFHLLVDCGDKFVCNVENVTKEHSEQDVYQLIMIYTLATSMVTLFDWNIDSFKDDTRWFDIYDKNLNNNHWNEIDLLFPGFLTKFNLTILSKEVRYYCHQILEACKRQPLSKTTNNFNVKDVILNLRKENNTNAKRMDKEVNANLKITDDLLAGQIWVFHTAGYLNNALTLTYALYHLAHNTDVQDKLTAEIDQTLDEHRGKLTYNALKEMKYLEMVFEETMRINPVTHGVVRSAYEDVKLEGTNVVINKGTTVVISPYSIHHDEQYYPEPEKFIPERFLPENVKKRHVCAYLPFGAGRRSCLGELLHYV